MSNPTCIMPECDRKPYCRKMCRPHYEADMGYTNVRVRAKVTYACEDCGATHQCDRRDAKKQTRCPACARKNAQRVRALAREPKAESCRVHTGKVCAHCGKVFTARNGKRKYCGAHCSREASLTKRGCRNRVCPDCHAHLGDVSLATYCEQCRTRRSRANRKATKAMRRALSKGADSIRVDPRSIHERDSWICGICNQAVDPACTYPDPMSPSLDHIIPLANGGAHAPANLQCSHLTCNIRKSGGRRWKSRTNFAPKDSARSQSLPAIFPNSPPRGGGSHDQTAYACGGSG